MKTAADQARAMGDYIREHGFSPGFDESMNGRPDCGCFMHAAAEVGAAKARNWPLVNVSLLNVIGARSFYENDLIAAGYASDADRDKAVKACYAAARMLEGK